jgi:hypothetical protein
MESKHGGGGNKFGRLIRTRGDVTITGIQNTAGIGTVGLNVAWDVDVVNGERWWWR